MPFRFVFSEYRIAIRKYNEGFNKKLVFTNELSKNDLTPLIKSNYCTSNTVMAMLNDSIAELNIDSEIHLISSYEYNSWEQRQRSLFKVTAKFILNRLAYKTDWIAQFRKYLSIGIEWGVL